MPTVNGKICCVEIPATDIRASANFYPMRPNRRNPLRVVLSRLIPSMYVQIVSQISLHMCMCYWHPPRIHGGLAISRTSA